MKKLFLGIGFLMTIIGAKAQNKTAQYTVEKLQKVNSEVYQLVFNPTNQLVYVVGPKKGFDRNADNHIYVLDGNDLTLVDSIPIGKNLPFGITLNNKTQTLYVGHSLQSSISAVDIKTKKHTLIPSGKEKSKIRELTVDEDRNLVYVSDHGNPSVWIVDGKTNTFKESLSYPDGYLLGLATDAKRGKIYLTDAGNMQGNIVVFNSDTKKLESTFKTWSYCPLNIAIDGKNNRLFVSQSNDNNVTVIDGNTGNIIDKVYLGYDASPIGLVYDENKNVLYTANRNKKEVAVIDAGTYKVLERIETKGLPNTISLDKTTGAIYITNKGAGRNGDPVENANTVLKIVKI